MRQTVHISAMPGPFGAVVEGLDVSTTLDEQTCTELVDALYEYRILLLPDQHVTEGQYSRFGRGWGEPIAFFVPQHRHAEFPELIRIRNSPSTPSESRDGAMHWHSDSSYEAEPAAVTMLYGVEAPRVGNETLFADMVAAYNALSPQTKQLIEDLQVIHDPSGGKVNLPGERRGSGQTSPLPAVTHPLVSRHPVLGRKALYGVSGTAAGIVGWAEEAALDLLIDLKRHVLAPNFRQRACVEVGSILLWDNYSVIHSATATEYSDEDGRRRLLYRISTKGVPRVHAAR